MKKILLLSSIIVPLLLSACGGFGERSGQESSSQQGATSLRNISVAPNDVVASPLTITGEAKGTWYFEASFPVHLYDAQNRELAVEPAQARGDWMTEDFVPFSVTLTFTPPVTGTGLLVFERDNPSGLPENAQSYDMVIRF